MTHATERSNDIARHVHDGMFLLRRSGVADLFPEPPEPERGRPRRNERLTVETFLVLLHVMFAINAPITWADMARLIVGQLDDTSRRLLGLSDPYWNDPILRRFICGERGDGTSPARALAGAQAIEAENRMRSFVESLRSTTTQLFQRMDTSVMAANVKHTVLELEAAQTADKGFRDRVALRDEVVHRLIIASLELGNQRHYGTHELGEGVFKNFQGHFGIDETKASVATGMHSNHLAPALQMARQSGYDRHLKHPDQVGMHALIAVSGQRTRQVPAVAVGMSFGLPGESPTPHVLKTIDLVQNLRPGLIPEPRRKARVGSERRRTTGARFRYIIGDKAYPTATGLLPGLLKRDFVLIGQPGKAQNAFVRLQEVDSRSTEGPMLTKQGAVLCPGASRQYLESVRDIEHPDRPTPAQQRQLDTFDRQMKAFTMGYKHSKPALKASKGRPRNDGGEALQWRMSVSCPAREGRLRCPLIERDPVDEACMSRAGIPRVRDEDLPVGELPRCCVSHSGTSTVVFSTSEENVDAGMRSWQPLTSATREHWDVYDPSRANTEAFFNNLKSENGARWTRGRCPWTVASLWSLAAAMATVRTNLILIDAFVRSQRDDGSTADDPQRLDVA